MNKFDYVTGYLPDDSTRESRQYKTRKKVRHSHINRGAIYLASIVSVTIVAIFVLSFMGTGNSISASSTEPGPVQQKQEIDDQPIWQSITMENNNK